MTPSAPSGGRIVIVSAGPGSGRDGPPDDLGRRLHARGWWVDRPDGFRILPRPLRRVLRSGLSRGPALRIPMWRGPVLRGPALRGPVRDPGADGLVARILPAVLDLLTGRASALLGDRPDAVVSTHPLVSRLLGRMRLRGLLDVPVISYLADPALHPPRWHAGVDLVLAPHPVLTGRDRLLVAQVVHDVALGRRDSHRADIDAGAGSRS